MNDDKLLELKEKYKNRNLMEELSWGAYYNHQGYTHKLQAEFLNWLCYTAYKKIKELERQQGKWIAGERNGEGYDYYCSRCMQVTLEDINRIRFCPKCGAYMGGIDNDQ